MSENVELVVKIASGGAGQTIKDVVELQSAIAKLGKDSKDAEKLAKSLGKAFNLPDDQVRDLADALAETKKEAKQLNKEGKGLNNVFQGIAQGIGQGIASKGIEAIRASLSAVIGVTTQAVGEFAAFEKALTEFDAKSTASAEQIARIGEQAKELAAVTSQTPAGVAELSTALLTLGATADQVEQNLAGITKLADVLGEDPVLTGQVVQTGINIFGEFGETADTLTDKLNFLINNSAAGAQGGLNEFFQLFSDVGGIAKSTEADFDELAASFAVLRNGGASASVAATGIKTALLALSSPTSAANAELEKIGLSAFDADGNFRGLETVLVEASEALKNASQQEQVEFATKVFGREGAPAFLTALSEANGGLKELIEGLSTRADGSLEESLETINQSLSRQVELLQGNLSGALTSFGEALSPVAAGVTEFLNELLSATIEGSEGFGELSEAGERLRLALTENPELVENLGRAIATVVDEGVDQLAQIIDAITALVSEEENIDTVAAAIKDLASVLQLLGQGARFVIALADALLQANEGTTFLERAIPPIRVFNAAIDKARAGADALAQQLERLGIIDLPEAQEFQGISGGLNQAAQALNTYTDAAQQVADAAPEKPIQETADATTQAAEETESAVKRVTDKYDELAQSSDLATQNLIADRLEQGASAEEIAGIEAKALNDRIALNRQKLAELKAVNQDSLSSEEQEALAQQIADTEAAIVKGRVQVAQDLRDAQIEAAKEARDAAIEAAEAQADALKEARDEQKRLAEESFGDDAEARERQFEDDSQARAIAQEDRLNAIREQGQAEIEALKESSQESLQADQEAFNRRQEAAARNFQKAQQAEAKAFQKALDAERDAESSRIDAAASEAEFQASLRLADSDEERDNLIAAREEARKRAEILAEEQAKALRNTDASDVPELTPIEQARLELEERIAAKQAEFQANQQGQAEAFEAGQRDQQAVFEAQQAERKKENEEAIAALEKQLQAELQEAERAFDEQERELDRQFQDDQQERERQFKEQQRQLDEQSARRQAQILAQARGGGIDGARRDGGPVKAGGTYLVGEEGPELITPTRGGYVHTARETAAMMLATRMPSAAAIVGADNRGIERRLERLISLVEANRQVQAQANYQIVNQGAPADPIAMELRRISGLARRGGLG